MEPDAMFIRCWGARGSIPVSGPKFEKYGGDTTCMEIRSKKGEILIIDAGSGLRNLGYSLVKEKVGRINMLFTHAHLDHLMGFPFFAPLFLKATKLTIQGPRLNKSSFHDVMADFLGQPYFPVQLGDKDIRSKLSFVDIDTNPFNIGSLRIIPIELSHPKNGGRGYRIEEGGRSFVFLTDNELGYIHGGGRSFEEYVEFSRGADLLIHDAEYTQKDYRHILAVSEQPWGHSLFTDAALLAVEANVARFGLFHHNQKRTDAQVDAMVKSAQGLIKKKHSRVECFGVGDSFTMTL
jgi:phosphoribosyl 1,2-cyclic phosphodiesterase